MTDQKSFVVDTVFVTVAFFVSYRIRDMFGFADLQPIGFYVPFIVFSVLTFLLSFLTFGLYTNHRSFLSFSYLVDFLRGVGLWGALLLAFSFFTKTDYSRIIVVLHFFISASFGFLVRLFFEYYGAGDRRRVDDKTMRGTLDEILKIAAFSSDNLALVEGIRRARAPSGMYFFLKRLFDCIFGAVGLLLSLPLFPFIVWYIKRDSIGPALISQERVGKDGKKFTLYKFRTMFIDTELYAKSPRGGGDPRVTKAGALLRRFSLDELPQFWNVLLGDMSIVGPRPEMPFIVETYSDWQRMRLAAKPGITGIWQILGRKDIPLEENIEYDLYYIFHQSFFLDVAIVLRTFPHLVFPKGAY